MSRRASGNPASQPDAAAKRRAGRILAALARSIPTPRVELNHRSPLEMLIATILSAQCTDQRVNQVTPALFRRYRLAADYASADQAELEALIRTTGFYKSKARSILGCCRALVERFGGEVPRTMEELVTLPGVGRKTANVILGACFGQPAVVVDTHVKRVAQRLGFTANEDPDKIEEDLQRLVPRGSWTNGSQRLLLHGRYVCLARKPQCDACAVYRDCDWEGKRRR
ncbi:MAG: endonuclease III [Nitrospirota bacterium]